MNTATYKRLNLHLEKADIMVTAKVPNRMKELIRENAKRLNMSESGYVKLAINNQLNSDLEDSTISNQNHKTL